jgi:hypothetical protein
LGLDEIGLAPGFVREAVDVWEAWEGRAAAPIRLQQLMLNLQIEVARRYKGYSRPPEKTKIPVYTDTRLV